MLREFQDRVLEYNERGVASLNNAIDLLFAKDSLVQLGQTPFQPVHQDDPWSLRYYPLPAELSIPLADDSRLHVRRRRHAIPLILVPPLGVTSETFDLMPRRSLVRYMAAAGFHTYLVDWGQPGKKHAHLGLADYGGELLARAIQEVRQHSGRQEVSLMGWCMGGLISLVYAGLSADPGVRNIVTVASPIDLRGGGVAGQVASVLNTPARLVRRFSRFRVHDVDPSRVHAPGWLTTLTFKLTDPMSSVTSYWDLLTRLWDREFVESHTTTSAYLNNMLEYPGAVIQDALVKMAVDNQLAGGRLEFGDRVADMGKVKADLLVMAGESDNLVPPDTARQIVEMTRGADKQFLVQPGGHMGVILGSSAQSHTWFDAASWLGKRSAARRRTGHAASL